MRSLPQIGRHRPEHDAFGDGRCAVSTDKLGDILNTPPEPGHAPGRPPLPAIRGHIRFEGVTFRYRPDAPEALRDISVEFEAGRTVGIVGRSGSGKSTFVKLVQRLHVPESGRVLIDGVDLAMTDPAWLRRQVGVVPQENLLFNRTVRDNIALAIPALFTVALVWAWTGEIDTVAVAQGRIIPAARTKTVQSREFGVVQAIHVREGQAVRQGEVLVELDSTESAADHARIEHDLMAARLDAARFRAMAVHPENPAAGFTPPAGTEPTMTAATRALMAAEAAEFREGLAELDAEIRRRRAERRTVEARVEVHRAVLPLVRERVEATATLVEGGHAGRLQLTELRERLVEHERTLAVERGRLAEVNETVAALARRRAQREAAHAAHAARELSQAMRNAARLEKELAKARERLHARRLRAPADGVVQQLSIHTVGGVVRPAEPLMTVVPAGSALEVEAMLLNRDVGFVREGQGVEIKVESFPFTRYGLISGHVVQVSADAVADQRAGLVYPVRITMNSDTMRVGHRRVRLGPGMAVTAEVKTGKRRILEFFLSPFMQYRDEALRER